MTAQTWVQMPFGHRPDTGKPFFPPKWYSGPWWGKPVGQERLVGKRYWVRVR